MIPTYLNLNFAQGVLGRRVAAAAALDPLDHEEPEVLPELPVPRPPDAQPRRVLALVALLSAIVGGGSVMEHCSMKLRCA